MDNLVSLVRQAARTMVDELVVRMRAAGYQDCSAAHQPIFENLDPGGTRLTTLAARTGLTHQSTSELVATLERLGYLRRLTDPTDRRARLVKLTARGRAAVRRAVIEIDAIEATWTNRLRAAGFDIDLRTLIRTGLARARD